MTWDDEEAMRIDDEDGDTSSDSDVCDRCGCSRDAHENDGRGECACGGCRRFKEVK
jgi:hypothetical protein